MKPNRSKEELLRRLAIFQAQVGQFTRALVVGIYAKEENYRKAQEETMKVELQDIFVQWKELVMDLGYSVFEIEKLADERYRLERLEHEKDEDALYSNFINTKKYVSPMKEFREQ